MAALMRELSNGPPAPSEPVRVVFVDDEPRLREVLMRAMESWGFSAVGARSAEEALKLLAADPADIAVLDLNLPVMGGIELFERLRQRWPLLQVIILSGFGDLEAARAAIRLDVVDFLKKPCHLGELEQALERARQRLPGPKNWMTVERNEATDDAAPPDDARTSTLEEVERRHILATLERNGGNRTATAAELGISRRTLQYRLAEYQRQGFFDE